MNSRLCQSTSPRAYNNTRASTLANSKTRLLSYFSSSLANCKTHQSTVLHSSATTSAFDFSSSSANSNASGSFLTASSICFKLEVAILLGCIMSSTGHTHKKNCDILNFGGLKPIKAPDTLCIEIEKSDILKFARVKTN